MLNVVKILAANALVLATSASLAVADATSPKAPSVNTEPGS